MAYAPTTDLLALLRQTSGGVRSVRMPGLDYILAALVRAGLFSVVVSAVAPVLNVVNTVWVQPAAPNSWAAEASVFLWNTATAEYEPATPALWAALLEAPIAGRSTGGDAALILTPANLPLINLTVPLTASRVWQLPLAARCPPGSLFTVADGGGIVGGFTLSIARQGADSLFGVGVAGNAFAITTQFGSATVRGDGVSGWYLVGKT